MSCLTFFVVCIWFNRQIIGLQIGEHGWTEDLKILTHPLGQNFWGGFSPVALEDIRELEHQLQRQLPTDFVEFYRTIGCRSFPDRDGGIYTPQEILQTLGAPIYFVLGSLSPGEQWCSEDEHRQIWLSRGSTNPAPLKFTKSTFSYYGVKLYDLLQIGTNGSCCYHQLYVGPQPGPFSYCLLTDYETVEDRACTFSEGIDKILGHYLSDLSPDA